MVVFLCWCGAVFVKKFLSAQGSCNALQDFNSAGRVPTQSPGCYAWL